MIIQLVADFILFLLIVLARKSYKQYREIKVLKVDVNNPIQTDAVIIKSQPAIFKVGEKTLYLQPLLILQYDRFMGLFEKFIQLHAVKIKDIQLFEFKEALDKKVSRKISHKTRVFLSQKIIAKEIDKLIEVAFLKDKQINPTKINMKYYKQNATVDDRLQLFFLSISLNIDSVESFLHALANRRSNAGQGRRNFSNGLFLNTSGLSNTQKKEPSHKPFYYSAENPSGKKRDETNSKINQQGVNT